MYIFKNEIGIGWESVLWLYCYYILSLHGVAKEYNNSLPLDNLCGDEFLANLDVDDGLFLRKGGLHVAHADTYFGIR